VYSGTSLLRELCNRDFLAIEVSGVKKALTKSVETKIFVLINFSIVPNSESLLREVPLHMQSFEDFNSDPLITSFWSVGLKQNLC